jgi:hypothetical protein
MFNNVLCKNNIFIKTFQFLFYYLINSAKKGKKGKRRKGKRLKPVKYNIRII